jgi:hypothetical protein
MANQSDDRMVRTSTGFHVSTFLIGMTTSIACAPDVKLVLKLVLDLKLLLKLPSNLSFNSSRGTLTMSEVKPLSTSSKVLVEKLVWIVLLLTSLVLKHWFSSVIFGTKLLIGQNLVRFTDILKHLFRLFLAFTKVFVGMPLESHFTV